MPTSVIGILKEYKKQIEVFLEKSEYLLAKAPPRDRVGLDKPEMVIPAVALGCLPHQNFSLYGAPDNFFQAPYIQVGFEDSDSENDESSINMLIQVCCYPSETYDATELGLPDNKSFIDLTLCLEWLRDKFVTEAIGGTVVDGPVKLGTYNSKELTYPYSFGYVSFSIKTIRKSRRNYDY